MKKLLTTLFSLLLIIVLLPISITNNEVKAEDPIPLTFIASEKSSITFNYVSGENVQYSYCGNPFIDYTIGKTIHLKKDDTVSFKGINCKTGLNNHFSMTGSIIAIGDVTSLTNGVGGDATLSDYCYQDMFNGCTSLTTAPNLPSTTLADYCYNAMFFMCENLTEAPDLPATTLTKGCYQGMFASCNLSLAPSLPATTLEEYCYNCMFEDCFNLSQAPELKATTLKDHCYEGMFYGCSSLTQAPELPATTLAISCYQNMFNKSGLTQAPELPATTLKDYCYMGMYEDCYSLTQAPVDLSHVVTLANECCSEMYKGCNEMKVYETSPNIDYSKEWRISATSGTSATNWNKDMFKDTGGSFQGNPGINKTYYIKGTPTEPIPCPTPRGDDMEYDDINGFTCEFIKGKASTATAHIDGVLMKDADNVQVTDITRTLTKDTDYVISPGSIKITLQPSYLNSLSVGTYVLRLDVNTSSFLITITVNKDLTPPYKPVDTSTK